MGTGALICHGARVRFRGQLLEVHSLFHHVVPQPGWQFLQHAPLPSKLSCRHLLAVCSDELMCHNKAHPGTQPVGQERGRAYKNA